MYEITKQLTVLGLLHLTLQVFEADVNRNGYRAVNVGCWFSASLKSIFKINHG